MSSLPPYLVSNEMASLAFSVNSVFKQKGAFEKMEKTETKISVISKTVPPRRAVMGRFEVTPGNRRDDTVVWTLTALSAAPCEVEERRHRVHSTWTSRFWQWWTRALFNLPIKFFRKYWNMLFVVVVRENPVLVVLQ